MRVPPLDDRTLELLEYPAVVERLSQLTSFSAGREAALALRPVVDRPRVVRRQRITAEVVHLSRLGAEVSLAGARDVRPLAERAERGQVLAAPELLDIADAARSAGNVRRTLVRLAPDAPLLGTIGGRIGDLGPLGSLIGQAISGRGEVLDEASPELGRIRRAVAAAHDQLQQRMQAMAQSPALRGVLQEPIVTIRDGRYVLPVRAESRGALRGVVHDRSASGATIYVEPLAVVDLGNRWRELQVQERHEVERVLRELSQVVGETEPEITGAVDRLAEVDLAMAKGRLARELRALDLHERGAQGWLGEAPGELQLLGARHPLLTGDVVANTIAVGESDRVLLITGPNTGGKTVALKTVGLLVLMAQAGLPVPADRGSHVPIYESVFADIGDEQSIEQSLSTFSGHITAVISVLERADERSLVLLDELGAGTDPTEGAALGIAIVDRLLASGASLVATTHHSELKLYAHRTGSVQNASMEFDLGSLTPTYRLTMGLPGQSNALAIAERLGMPNEVVELARSGLSGEERQLETVLGELRAQLAAAERRAVAAADDAERARRLRREREQELDSLAGESMRLREEARIRIRDELSDVRRLLQRSRREIEAARLAQAAEDFRRAEEAADRLREEAAGSESGGSDPAAMDQPEASSWDPRQWRMALLTLRPEPGKRPTSCRRSPTTSSRSGRERPSGYGGSPSPVRRSDTPTSVVTSRCSWGRSGPACASSRCGQRPSTVPRPTSDHASHRRPGHHRRSRSAVSGWTRQCRSSSSSWMPPRARDTAMSGSSTGAAPEPSGARYETSSTGIRW